MPLTRTKRQTGTDSAQVRRRREETEAQTRQAVAENNAVIQQLQTVTPQQQQSPGFFRRLWNRISGAFARMFSRQPNTATQNGGDAVQSLAETQVQAPAPDSLQDTLTPEQTSPQEPDSTAPTQETQSAQPETAPSEGSPETTAQAPQAQENTLTLGNLTFTLEATEREGVFRSMAGTAQVLGKKVDWTSEEGVEIEKDGESGTAHGTITLTGESLTFRDVFLYAANSQAAYEAKEGSQFSYHAGSLDLDFTPQGDLGDLSQITGREVVVKNRALAGKGEQTEFPQAELTVTGPDQYTITPQEIPVDTKDLNLPDYLQVSQSSMALRQEENQLVLGVDLKELSLHLGKFRFLSVDTVQGADVKGTVEENGAIAVPLPKEISYTFRLFNGLYTKDVSDAFQNTVLHFGQQAQLRQFEFQPISLELGGFHLENLLISYGKEKGDFSAKLEKLSGLEGKLTASDLELNKDETGFFLPSFQLSYNDPASTLMKKADFQISNFKIQEKTVLFDQAKADVQIGEAMAKKGVTSLALTAFLHKDERELSLLLSGRGQVSKTATNFAVNGENLDFVFQYNKDALPEPGRSKLGSFLGSVNGKITLTVQQNSATIVDAVVENGISLTEQGFTLGNVTAFLNLNNLGNAFSAQGSLRVGGLTISEQGIHTQNLSIYLKDPMVYSKSLGEELEIQYDPTTGFSGQVALGKDLTFAIGEVGIAIKEPTVFLGMGGTGMPFRPGVKDTKLEITAGSNIISGEIKELVLGQPIQLDSLGLENARLAELVKSVTGADHFTLQAKGITIGAQLDSITVEEFGASVTTDINLLGSDGGLKLTGIGVSVVAPNLASFDGIKLEGTLNYTGNSIVESAEGSLTLAFLKEKNFVPSIEEVSDVKFGIKGYGEASISSIQRDETGTLVMEQVSIFKNSGKEDTGEDTESSGTEEESLIQKIVALAPNVQFLAEKITYDIAGFHLDPNDIKVKQISTEVKINDYLKLALAYGDEQGLSAALQATFAVPSARKKDSTAKQRLFAPKFQYPVFPLLTLEAGAYLDAGLMASAQMKTAFKTGLFTGALSAKANAGVAAGLMANVKLGVPGFNGKLGAEGGVDLEATGDLAGNLQVTYDKTPPRLVDRFGINRENTNLNYNFNATLGFDVRLIVGGEVPPIFDANTRTLHKSWNLFHYNLGNAALHGKILYVDGSYELQNQGELNFNVPGAFHFDEETEKLELLTTSVSEMQASNQEICDLLDRYQGTLGLGNVRDTLRLKQIQVISEKLNGTMKTAAENSRLAFLAVNKLREQLSKILEQAHRGEQISADTLQAAEIAGISMKEDGTAAMKTFAEFVEEQKQKQNDEDYLARLALLDPLAVYNTFKAYKRYVGLLESSSKYSWDDLYQRAKTLSDEMRQQELEQNAAAAGETISSAEPSRAQKRAQGRTRTLFTDNLNNINKLVLSNFKEVQNAYSALEKETEKLDQLKAEENTLKEQMGSAAQKEKAKLEKRLAANTQNQKKQEEAVKKARQQVDTASAKSKSKADSSVINNAFNSVISVVSGEREKGETQYNIVTASRTQEFREGFQENNKAFVKDLIQKLIQSNDNAEKAGGADQRKQVNRRVAQVTQGKFVEQRLDKEFNQLRQNHSAADWQQIYSDYTQKILDFEKQHQQAYNLHDRLASAKFSDQDDGNLNRVSQQNALLQEACAALNSTISDAEIQDRAVTDQDVAELNNALREAMED